MALLLAGISPILYKYYRCHAHSCYEIILNLEGEGIISIDGEEYPFYPGSIHIIPKNAFHVKSSANGFRDIYFHADALPLSKAVLSSGKPIVLSDDTERSLENLMKMMLCRYLQKNNNDGVLAAMYELIVKLIAEKCAPESKDPAVEVIVNKIMLSFSDPEFSISDMLKKTGYNKDYIRRRFISAYGMTPIEYLTEIRIENAKRLLINRRRTLLSVADVGTMCGYCDAGYFARIFKRKTGYTPLEFSSEAEKSGDE